MTNVIKDEYVERGNGILRRRRVSDVTAEYDLSGDYVNLEPLIESGADYIIAFSGRSDGKTTSALTAGLKKFRKTGKKIGIIRRYADEMRGASGENLFAGITALGRIPQIFPESIYDQVSKWGERWYFSRFDEEQGRDIRDKEPFAYGFALNTETKYKSSSWESIGFILFDEFITRQGYMSNESSVLLSLISTIVRDNNGIPVVLCGNVLNKYNPYFECFDIKEAKDIPKGKVWKFESWDEYKGEDPVYSCKLIYYSDKNAEKGGKKSDSYFFGLNDKSALMTTKGEWEVAKYPEPPEEVNYDNIKRRFYLIFDGEYVEGLIVKGEHGAFLYFRRCYELPQDVFNGKLPLFSLKPSNARNVFYSLYHQHPKLYYIGKLLTENRVFYETNEVGEIVRNYLNEMRNI